jgi:hypothetical protein
MSSLKTNNWVYVVELLDTLGTQRTLRFSPLYLRQSTDLEPDEDTRRRAEYYVSVLKDRGSKVSRQYRVPYTPIGPYLGNPPHGTALD